MNQFQPRLFFGLFAACFLSVGWAAHIGAPLPVWPDRPIWVVLGYIAAAGCGIYAATMTSWGLQVATASMFVYALARTSASAVWPSNTPGMFIGVGAWGLITLIVIRLHLLQRHNGVK